MTSMYFFLRKMIRHGRQDTVAHGQDLRLRAAGTLSHQKLTKRNVFGNLEGAGRRGRGGKERKIDCVQSGVRAFGIAGEWKATALEAGI